MKDTISALMLIPSALIVITFAAPKIRAGEQHASIPEANGDAFIVHQRSSQPVPGLDENIEISLGDITGWMGLVSLAGKDSTTVLRETPIAAGEMIPFKVKDRKYILFLARINNALIGEDTAEFRVVRYESITDSMKRADAEKKSVSHTMKVGDTIKTNVSGTIKFDGITKGKNANLRSDGKLFSLQNGYWAHLSNDEMVKVTAVSEKRHTVTLQLYQPAPFPSPY